MDKTENLQLNENKDSNESDKNTKSLELKQIIITTVITGIITAIITAIFIPLNEKIESLDDKKNEKEIKKLVKIVHENYVEAVNKRNLDIVNKYIIEESDIYREYKKNIEICKNKNIKLENKGQTIKYIKKENDTYRVTCVNKFKKNTNGSIKYQKEEMDYIIIKDVNSKKFLIDKIENWQEIDKK